VSDLTVWTRPQMDFAGIALELHGPAEYGVRADADEVGRVAQSGPKCLAEHVLYVNRSRLLHPRSVWLSIQKAATFIRPALNSTLDLRKPIPAGRIPVSFRNAEKRKPGRMPFRPSTLAFFAPQAQYFEN
jgi:hypothetical protein